MSFADNINIVSGQAASGSANAGNPVKSGGVYNATPPALSSGQVVDTQVDANGNTLVNVANGVPGETPGTAPTVVIGIQGASGMIPIKTAVGLATSGGASYSNAIAPATPAVTTVKSSAGNIYSVTAFNSTTGPVFLKFFDAASVTLGTTACSFQYMIPGNTTGAGFTIPIPAQRSFANGIKYAVTLNIATNDNTAITANSVIVDISYN